MKEPRCPTPPAASVPTARSARPGTPGAGACCRAWSVRPRRRARAGGGLVAARGQHLAARRHQEPRHAPHRGRRPPQHSADRLGQPRRRGRAGGIARSGARSDTTLIAHVSADREHVTVVSVPRDSMVPAPPGCKNSTPKEQWVVQQWNAMFSIGGPACLITTIEGNTGLRMDHFAVVDFRGFRDMVDALGGVPICAPEAIDDPKAKLARRPVATCSTAPRRWATCGPARRSGTAPTSGGSPGSRRSCRRWFRRRLAPRCSCAPTSCSASWTQPPGR